MPPKVKTTKDEIVSTALSLVRECGAEAINARSIASSLGCSTQPVFSNFASMNELREAVISSAYAMYLDFIKSEEASEKYPKYKAFGMAYVRFAKEEKELFKLLFMRDRRGEDLSPSPDFEASVEMIMNSLGVSREKASLLHLENWTYVHGVAVMLATSFLPLELDLVSDMLSDVYHGLRARHLSEN